VTTTQFGLLGIAVGVVWFLVIVLLATVGQRRHRHPA
jgi:threonine/homoserine/homoserine lactone efflux protein